MARLEHVIPDSSSNRGESSAAASGRTVDALDLELGRRVERARQARGFSARQLGEAIGVSQQQIRRYETGADRMAASTLLRTCAALAVPLDTLCSGLDRPAPSLLHGPPAIGTAERLMRDYESIPAGGVRSHLCRLVAALASNAALEEGREA